MYAWTKRIRYLQATVLAVIRRWPQWRTFPKLHYGMGLTVLKIPWKPSLHRRLEESIAVEAHHRKTLSRAVPSQNHHLQVLPPTLGFLYRHPKIPRKIPASLLSAPLERPVSVPPYRERSRPPSLKIQSVQRNHSSVCPRGFPSQEAHSVGQAFLSRSYHLPAMHP